MSEWLKIIILGIIEGTTEFLPISSTGHLIVGTALLSFQNHMNGTFIVFIQLGAVLAVIAYYWRDLLQQAREITNQPDTRHFWLAIAIAVIPISIIGFISRDMVKELLFTPSVVALALIGGGLIFLYIERRPLPEETHQDMKQVTLRQALIIGGVQILALIPGMSRSGASIIGGMQAGLSRKAATQFSFYLAIPTLGGATIYELLTTLSAINRYDLTMLIVGAAVSAIVAWLSIGWLLRFVAHHSFVAFGYYRIVAGAIILVASAAGWL